MKTRFMVLFPSSADAVKHIRNAVLSMTALTGTTPTGPYQRKTVDGMEANLASMANQVFTTSIGLYDTLKNYNPDTVMLPNGVNFEHFNQAASGSLRSPTT